MPEMQQRASLISSSAAANSTSIDAQAEDPHSPTSIPPWVHVNDATTDDAHLISSPSRARPNTRHYKPPPAHYKPGRKWDHLRSPSPPLLTAPITEHQVRWRPFVYSGPNPREQHDGARVVSQAWMEEHMPALSQGWREEDEQRAEGEFQGWGGGLMYKGKWLISPERQERTVRLFWRLLLRNPFVPLAFRITVMAFTAAALGIAGTIFHQVDRVNRDPNPNNQCAIRASSYMAIVVGTVAIPYLGYVTWDEYMSKPLGLRSVAAKTLLLLCDLYFVVFSASNLSLAFDALYDHRWACYDEKFAVISTSGDVSNPVYDVPATCPNNPSICYKQKALSAVLFIGLISWLMTFSMSVMRVVEKLRPD